MESMNGNEKTSETFGETPWTKPGAVLLFGLAIGAILWVTGRPTAEAQAVVGQRVDAGDVLRSLACGDVIAGPSLIYETTETQGDLVSIDIGGRTLRVLTTVQNLGSTTINVFTQGGTTISLAPGLSGSAYHDLNPGASKLNWSSPAGDVSFAWVVRSAEFVANED